MGERVLVVEDLRATADLLSRMLVRQGFDVIIARDGPEGLDKWEREQPDAVVLDLVLPGMDGLEILQRMRPRSDAPVVILSAKSDESERVQGIDAGADDYIVKPFSMRDLLARLQMVLRRARISRSNGDVIAVRDIVIDPTEHSVIVRGQQACLSPKEFALLEFLARNRGAVLSRPTILERVWGSDEFIDERTVDVHIRWLRRKLERNPSKPELIITIRGEGYKLVA